MQTKDTRINPNHRFRGLEFNDFTLPVIPSHDEKGYVAIGVPLSYPAPQLLCPQKHSLKPFHYAPFKV